VGSKPLLSIVVPIYNEIATAEAALDAIVHKQVEGWETEVILIESNSTDGTREVVQRIEPQPRVLVLYEDRARGKGHAVRAGLARARGEVVLIQDADLEYSLDDYERLLAPIAAGERSFVLGSRHLPGRWAIRKFTDQPLQALTLNLAHWFFTLCINAALGVWLRDPFTMYKVFRRECIRDLPLEANRFDFDWELLIKLIRRGHRPVEIPVSYVSRSFKEGKKIALFRDPLTWMWALVKYRLVPVPPQPAATVPAGR
jgi:glycosyltransferase involved in cell wall biosynthesis